MQAAGYCLGYRYKYPDNSEYVIWFAYIVGLDAISSIPMARLRVENKAIRFAIINMANILVNIGLNVFWVYYCIPAYNAGESNFILNTFYSPEIGIGYVFIANLFATIVKFVLLSPYFLKIKLSKENLSYIALHINEKHFHFY